LLFKVLEVGASVVFLVLSGLSALISITIWSNDAVCQTSGLLTIHEVIDSLLILSLYNLIICSVAAVLAADQSPLVRHLRESTGQIAHLCLNRTGSWKERTPSYFPPGVPELAYWTSSLRTWEPRQAAI
jgi:hypothetical protein